MMRALDPVADAALVDAFWETAADYIRLERGEAPSPALTQEYFTDAPPGSDPARSQRLGLFRGGGLVGVIDLAFDFPEPGDAYLGLLVLARQARGAGLGRLALREVEARARAAGAARLYLGVLEANPRGRAFWEREGFRLARAGLSVTLGPRTQIAHRLVKELPPGA